MNQCLCCRDRLIKHLNQTRMYWFCPSCYQEMPNVDVTRTKYPPKVRRPLITQKECVQIG